MLKKSELIYFVKKKYHLFIFSIIEMSYSRNYDYDVRWQWKPTVNGSLTSFFTSSRFLNVFFFCFFFVGGNKISSND